MIFSIKKLPNRSFSPGMSPWSSVRNVPLSSTPPALQGLQERVRKALKQPHEAQKPFSKEWYLPELGPRQVKSKENQKCRKWSNVPLIPQQTGDLTSHTELGSMSQSTVSTLVLFSVQGKTFCSLFCSTSYAKCNTNHNEFSWANPGHGSGNPKFRPQQLCLAFIQAKGALLFPYHTSLSLPSFTEKVQQTPACLYLPPMSRDLSARPAPGEKRAQTGVDWSLFSPLMMQWSFAERLGGHCWCHAARSLLTLLPLSRGCAPAVRKHKEGAKINPIFVASFFMARKFFLSIFNSIWWGKST